MKQKLRNYTCSAGILYCKKPLNTTPSRQTWNAEANTFLRKKLTIIDSTTTINLYDLKEGERLLQCRQIWPSELQQA